MSVLQSDVGVVYPCYGVFQCDTCSQNWVSMKTWIGFGQPCENCKTYKKAIYVEKLYYYVCINCGYQWQNRKVPQPFCAKCYASDPKPFSTMRERLRYMKVHFLSHPEKDEEEDKPVFERRSSMVHRKKSCDRCQAGKICTWYRDKTRSSISPTGKEPQNRNSASNSEAESDAEDSVSDFVTAVRSGNGNGPRPGNGNGRRISNGSGTGFGFGTNRKCVEEIKKSDSAETIPTGQPVKGKERPSKLFDVVKTRKASLVRLHNEAHFFRFSGKTSTQLLGVNSSTSTSNPNRADCCCFI